MLSFGYFLMPAVLVVSSVIAQQNKAPVWVETLQDTLGKGIKENSEVGSRIGFLRAIDPENTATIEYYVDSDTLNVNRTTGEVTLAHLLDYENQGTVDGNPLQVKFIAREKGGQNEVPVTVTIVVIDVNDNKPEFLDTPYNFQVSELEDVRTLLFNKIRVTDRDSGYNAEVRLMCHTEPGHDASNEACFTFSVRFNFNAKEKITTGRIYLQRRLDYERTTSYVMTLQAIDNGAPEQLSTLVNVHITVIDKQDRPPLFSNVPITFYVNEDASLYQKIGDIQVRDGDAEVVRAVNLSIVSDVQTSMFKLGPTRRLPKSKWYAAPVLTNQLLNREDSARYEFKVLAVELENGVETTEPNSRFTETVAVNIIDVNDNAPTFDKRVYNVDVYEVRVNTGRTTIPDLTMLVTDPDEARNANFSLTVVSETFSGSTVIFPNIHVINGASFYVSVDNRYLDYEQPQYHTQQIVLKAEESGTNPPLSSTATVNIKLIPINDHAPKFSQKQYIASVPENMVKTTLFRNVTATDDDIGNSNHSDITYQLHGAYSDWFKVANQRTGTISLVRSLDYEKTQSIDLVYIASDKGIPALKGSTRLRINVINLNDIPPKFSLPEYTATVKETSTQLRQNSRIVATDLETGQATITYRIVRGNTADDAFVIGRTSGVLTLKRSVKTDETVNGKFVLVVEASDNESPPLVSLVNVIVTVQDENTHDPIFSLLEYSAKVPETAEIGDFVIQIKATDKDTGNNGKIRYRIRDAHDSFKIDASTGKITVKEKLNYDLHKSYILKAEARDMASPPRTGSADVNVTVIDKNNQNPVFHKKVYDVSVNEAWERPKVILTVGAKDSDTDSDLHYSLIPSTISAMTPTNQPFTNTNVYDFRKALAITKDGQVFINEYLKYKYVAKISFTVQVMDKNSITGLQIDRADVTVRVIKSIDLQPYFAHPWTKDNPSYLVSILEEGKPGSPVTTLVAMDPQKDGSIKPITHFEKVPNSDPNNYFTVRRLTGEIVINEPIDYEKLPIKLLLVQVRAISADKQKVATAIINIQISDINDHSPIFKSPGGYSFTVYENSDMRTEVGRVEATDGDSNQYANLVYNLLGRDSENFIIYNSGLIMLAENASIDREYKSEYDLKVEARDNPEGLQYTSTKVALKIKVLDRNDNAPKFTQQNYKFYIVDSLSPGTSIGQLSAIDPDEFRNGMFRFIARSNSSAAQLIKVDPLSGLVTTTDYPSRYAFSHELIFHVTAEDFGTPPMRSTVTMTIIQDTRSEDGKPIFRYPLRGSVYNQLYENADIGTVVATANASSTRGVNHTIRYSFHTKGNDDYKHFSINRVTGVITVNASLDRETQEDYELRIKARDVTGDPVTETVEMLIVKLKDENDNRPVFGQAPCSAELKTEKVVFVEERSVAGTEVVQVSACDKDIAPNNQIRYTLSASARDDFAPKLRLMACYLSYSHRLHQDYQTRSTRVAATSAALRKGANIVDIINKSGDKSNTFWIKPLTSAIEISSTGTLLDYENATEHVLCVEATDGVGEPALAYIRVKVLDVNDNGPKFVQKKHNTVIVDTISRGEKVMVAKATDEDTGDNARVLYSIRSIDFHRGQTVTEHLEAFLLNPSNGQLTTAMSPYTEFTGGYFLIDISAHDYHDNSMSDSTVVTVVVVDESYLMMAVVKRKEDEAPDVEFRNKWKRELQGALNTQSWNVSITEVKYNLDEQDNVNTQKIDMCFVTTKENGKQAVSSEDVKNVLGDSKTFNTVNIDHCVRYKTVDDVSPYWWVLIALAVFIFLCTVILIAIFVIMSNRYKSQRDRLSLTMVPSS